VTNVDFSYEPEDETVRSEVRGWLTEHLVGDFARIGGGYDLDAMVEARLVLGPDSQILESSDESVTLFQGNFLFSRAHAISAGASELQRNIIGERILGLSREPERRA
jgi:hypothetical protein